MPVEQYTKPETWRPVVGYENQYSVSDHGRVKSHTAHACKVRDKDGVMRTHLLRGYRRLELGLNGKGSTRRVCVLVLEAFRCPRPVGLVCDHIDGDPSNDSIDNLQWVTTAENTRRGRVPKLNQDQVLAIRESRERQTVLAERYDVNVRQIRRIIKHEQWVGLRA